MKHLWRAAADDDTFPGMSFGESRAVAELYTDNCGFGGGGIYSATVPTSGMRFLDLNGRFAWQTLGEALGMDPIDAEDDLPGRVSGSIAAAVPALGIAEELEKAGYDWVRVEEDYPEGTTTWQPVSTRAVNSIKLSKKNPPEDHSIYTHGRFWGAAGAGILLIAASTGRILVGLRSRYVNEPGTWGTFGGKLDEGEDPAEAAMREVQEELGYNHPIAVKLVYIYESGTFHYFNFVGLILDEFPPRLNWETEEARWVTPEELRALHNKHYGLKALLENYP